MKRYALEYTEDALKDLKRLDKSVAKVIVAWMKKNIDGCLDPRVHGKGLTANYSGKWRYRRCIDKQSVTAVFFYIAAITIGFGWQLR